MKEKQLLEQSAIEIAKLRNQNNFMSARLNMFDNIMTLLSTNINNGGMERKPDILGDIQQYLKDAETPRGGDGV